MSPPAGDRRGDLLAQLAIWFGCTFICLHVLLVMGFEGTWYPLHDAMQFEAIPPFRHRVLFVLLARAVQALQPAFHDPRCYFISQVVAAGIAFWAIRPWAARFVPSRVATLSGPLLLMMLLPSFTYWTFYDLGIVATYTLALWALLARRYWLYLAIFAIATLNHENSLLLVPLALLGRYRTWRLGLPAIGWAALQVGVYLALRGALFQLLPADAAWQSGKLVYNFQLLTHAPGQIARAVLLLGTWTVVIVAGWQRVPEELRWAFVVLGSELMLVTLLFGQLNELRQFDALMPVMVAAMLSVFAGTARGTSPPRG